MRYQTLQLFRPVITKNITQGWGENLACVRNNGSIFGIKRGQTCPHGTKSFYKSMGMLGHSGIDFGSMIGEEVYHAATFDGWIRNEIDNYGGIGVDVVSNEPIFFPHPIPPELFQTAIPHTQDGKVGFIHYVKIRNWHLHGGVGHEGKQVTCGTVIGLAGNTGASSGPHLHWAPKWCAKDGRGVASNNGYYGAFDPNPYYNHNVLARDHAEWLRKNIIPLTEDEKKDIREQLSLATRLLVTLKKSIHKI